MIRRPDLPRGVTPLLAILAGLALGAGQPPLGWWPLVFVGVAAFTWIMTGRTRRGALGYGYLAGLALNTLTIHWISVLGPAVAVGLIAYSSLWFALLAVAVRELVRLRLWPAWVALAWVATEFVSGKWPFGGFAWNRLGFTTIDQPLAGFLPWLGASGVGLLVAWLSQLLLSRRWVLGVGAFAVAFALGAGLSLVPLGAPEQRVTVAVVQPGVNRHEYGGRNYARAVTNNALSATILAMAEARSGGRDVDFVLWPESASDHDPLRDERARRQVDLATRLADAPVLVGAVTLPDDPPDSRQTTGIWWTPTQGPVSMIHKRNLVPFGEWIPFRELLLPRIPMLRMIGRQSVPGETPGMLEAPTQRYPSLLVGDIICFELAYDDTVYDVVTAGSNVIVSQSNENTYAGTWQVPQQQAMNRVRARELGREVVVSTLNSISGSVDTKGRFLEATDEFLGASRIVDVPLRYQVTPAVTVGPGLARGATGLTVAALIVAACAGRRRARLERTSSKEVSHGG